MNVLAPIVDPIRRLGLEGRGGLRPSFPTVALEVGTSDLVLVRVRSRRGRVALEACEVRPLESGAAPAPGRSGAVSGADLAARAKEAFETSGTKIGKISLVLPDSMAKVALVTLPERPASAKQLGEMVRFKLRRAVPFRLEEAAIAFQLLPGSGPEVGVLVAAMPRTVLEPYERALEQIGARPGLVSLCTPSLFNLWREALDRESAGADAALLNCTPAYFSLLIVRQGRLIFYRCKSLAGGDDGESTGEGMLPRELGSSLSYYREKLEGSTIGTTFVRTVSRPFEEVAAMLEALGVERVEPLDPSPGVDGSGGGPVDAVTGQRIAPALGAIVGWR